MLRSVLLVTLSRFWMEAGTPTAQTPPAMSLRRVKALGETQTSVVFRRTVR